MNVEYQNIHQTGPTIINLTGIQYKRYNSGKYVIKCKDNRNNCVILNDNTAVRCLNFIKTNEAMYIVGKQFVYASEIYHNPRPSSYVGCFFANESPELNSWNCENIRTKAYVLPYNGEFAILPLLHVE